MKFNAARFKKSDVWLRFGYRSRYVIQAKLCRKSVVIRLFERIKCVCGTYPLDLLASSRTLYRNIKPSLPYAYLNYKNYHISFKLDDEGVCLDVLEGVDCIATTWRLYQELEEGED